MIGRAFTAWLAAVLVALVCAAAQVLDADPEALQDVADDVVAAQLDARMAELAANLEELRTVRMGPRP